ncbi:hypothetical protein GP486_007532 [Trichoglossum hirsutum]|uniref:Uncharacterized protein n=1 Tax=Trichoglossum hirsutum TaxID=265104 RepID=A0A9P8IFN2_9PEZI|nr:hypothetical protein GP486_007532 [Trichoglossum hirsutum]
MVLAVASILFLVFIQVSGLNGTGTVRDGYFALIDTHEYKRKVDSTEYVGLPDSHDYSKQKDVYAIYLWNYCSGNLKDGVQDLNFCSKPNRWFFDLYSLWSTWGIKIAEPGSKWYWLRTTPKSMLVAYNIATAASILQVLVGFSAIFSRWGSFVTLFFSGVSRVAEHTHTDTHTHPSSIPILRSRACRAWMLTKSHVQLSFCMFLSASALSTAIYNTLVQRINELDNIHARRGSNIFIASWIGTALSLGAVALWAFSTCCVSGKDKKKPRVKPEKTPYTYDRVAEPYVDSSDTQNLLPTGHRGEGKDLHLEPYRHA